MQKQAQMTVQGVLKHAMRLQRSESVAMLLRVRGVTVSTMNMLSLYLVKDTNGFLSSNATLQHDVGIAVRQAAGIKLNKKGKKRLMSMQKSRRLSTMVTGPLSARAQVKASIQRISKGTSNAARTVTKEGRKLQRQFESYSTKTLQLFGAENRQDGYDDDPGAARESEEEQEAVQMYISAVGKFFMSLSVPIGAILCGSHKIRVHDLFFWATLMGNFDLQRVLWKITDHPIHAAVVGAHICRQYSKSKAMVGPVQTAMAERAGVMQ
eukprot:4600649-Prymnesium_polylepis.1